MYRKIIHNIIVIILGVKKKYIYMLMKIKATRSDILIYFTCVVNKKCLFLLTS